MNRDSILKYINQPDRLDQDSLPEIEELVNVFPYFQTAYLLHVKNHHNIKSLKFNDSLKSASVRVGDRAVLYHLIHDMVSSGFQDEVKTVDVVTPVLQKESVPEIMQATIPEINSDIASDEIIPKQMITASTEITDKIPIEETSVDKSQVLSGQKSSYPFNGWFDHLDQKTPLKEEKIPDEEKKLKEKELIDAFIKIQPKIVPDKNITGEQQDISEAFIRHEDQMMTETLAQIYFRQGYYFKAIHVYEKLSLKFPEKSSYFATQINKIRQCIS